VLTSLKAPSMALLNVPRTTSPAPWMAAAAAFMGFVVCFEVGTVVFAIPAGAAVALVLASIAAVIREFSWVVVSAK
jgi:hypothetical protein